MLCAVTTSLYLSQNKPKKTFKDKEKIFETPLDSIETKTAKTQQNHREQKFITYISDPKKGQLQLHWKNDSGAIYKTFESLEQELKSQNKKLVFAMNGGMFMENYHPLGLYIEKGEIKRKVNTIQEAFGNFYLQPNGIFYLTEKNTAGVCQTSEFSSLENIAYATQSGPMLLINGEYHPELNEGSSNVNVRNGVGILPDGEVLFCISKGLINFYDFAKFFKDQGCENALYLDGVVSRVYIPEQDWKQNSGQFGVIIAESEIME